MEQQVLDIARDAVFTLIKLASPLLGVALIVGLAISIFQATTQIQEQTLSFVPKIIAVFLAVFIFGSWMITTLKEFTLRLYDNILQFIYYG
ncbi:MAG TPA: flagellar biosynthetic protein FliQ [Ruminiclostridium sp.]|jgi:flagellar biosynthetic protein FliQ|nr:flagellar biosynthesis protein FliQ [Clostridiaceae bacterium]HAA25026.1 flagellar biosynthetic protein FliQ [Ruminiclostridium sp.]